MSRLLESRLDVMEFQHEKVLYKCFLTLQRLVECFSDIFDTSAIAGGGGGRLHECGRENVKTYFKALLYCPLFGMTT